MNSLSVIIPFYNNNHFLDSCLHSVYIQNLKNIDVIIVDDNSNESISSDIINKFLSLGLKINVIKLKKNSGPGFARFIGINQSKSDLIAFLDSDDEWLPDKLKEQIYLLKDNNIHCVASKIIDRNIETYEIYERGFFLSTESFLKDLLDQKISIPMSTIVIKREILIKKINQLRYKINFNLDHFELLLIATSLNFSFINKPYAYYNLHNSNISKNNQYTLHYSKVLFSFSLSNFNNKKFTYLWYSFKYFLKYTLDVFK